MNFISIGDFTDITVTNFYRQHIAGNEGKVN